jgi:hypothetical protein
MIFSPSPSEGEGLYQGGVGGAFEARVLLLARGSERAAGLDHSRGVQEAVEFGFRK